ncbi:TetR/AcrR family transcriptional regulator [Shewanella profunda]|uniref:TetR/AcrR family transcriptional regulator n=1 Tax=Shewanella profunda TaxID=254793 RepID=UPI00200D4A81|nr:TetR/AcrR family transcriptional regulator [Shewanella profunda]MCL1089115.1 TetR/AcrR family transcriptional regulator [Shewanella profunda]
MLPDTDMGLITEEDQKLTRGYKKKARTRQALLNAALNIYAEKGVSELLLNELAEKAEVSNGTVYNYFRSREAVLEAVGMELADKLSDQITKFSQGIESGAERLAIGVRMFIREGRRDRIWAGAVVNIFQYDSRIRTAVANNLRGDLQLGSRQGMFNYGSEAIAVTLVASATTGMMAAILDGYDQLGADVILTEMLLLGLGVDAVEAHRIAHLPLPETEPQSSTVPTKKPKRGRPRNSG